MKILVADDNIGTLTTLNIGLTSYGFDVVAAHNARQALFEIQSALESKTNGNFDLLLTDFRMPGMNGLELINSARKLIPKLPAILVTAHGNESMKKTVSGLECCMYLDKPLPPTR